MGRGEPERVRVRESSEADPERILLFDGVCNLCNAAVGFILERDRRRRFRFASLQSEAGRRLLERHDLDADELSSLVLVEEGRAHVKSAGALRLARGLGLPWSLLYVFILLPRPLRDALYSLVARNRYRWFGRREACMMPTPERLERFLE